MRLNFMLLLSTIYCAFSLVHSAQLSLTFRTPKNIAFVAPIPGSSHITWVLPFLNELNLRGHNITFISVDENQKYLKNYNGINFYSLGKSKIHADVMFSPTVSHPDMSKMLPLLIKHSTENWKSDFSTFMNLIKEKNLDILVCDHFSTTCFEAADTADIPSVMTSTLAMTSDAKTNYINNEIHSMSDFTTEHQSIAERLYIKFVNPLKVLYSVKDALFELAEIKRKGGLADTKTFEDPESKIKHSLKIVGNSYGLEPARPVGPLVEYIGSVVSETYPELDALTENYLNHHKKVVYVAFGQNAMPIVSDVTNVLSSLIIQWEKGHIDGIIWSSKIASVERFPEFITSTYTGKSYPLAPLFSVNRNDINYNTLEKNHIHDIYVINWAPQVAILLHPSVEVFVSHGGANSITESLYTGNRLIIYPFFGDQEGNGNQLTKAGVAEYFTDKTKQEKVNQLVEKVILDKDGSYQANTKKYQAIIQIQSQHAPIKAADLIEEVLFTSTGKLIKHREDVGRSISFIKRNNLDLYGILIFSGLSILTVILLGLKKLGTFFYNYIKIQNKLKTN
ncbi:unnamed protein product [Cunninghamella blakesleeana]